MCARLEKNTRLSRQTRPRKPTTRVSESRKRFFAPPETDCRLVFVRERSNLNLRSTPAMRGFRAIRRGPYLCRGRGRLRRRRTRTRPARPSRARPRGGTPCARGATRAESGHWNICDEREEGAPGRVLVTHFEHRSVGAGGAGSSRGSSPSAIDGVGGRACVPRRGRDGQTRAHHLHRDVCAGASVLRSERRQGKYQRVSSPSIGDVSRSRSRVFSPPSPSTETHTEPHSGFPRHHADARRVLPRVVRSPNPPSREGTGEARPPLRLRASHRPERHVGR